MPAFGESCRRRGHVFSSLDDPQETCSEPRHSITSPTWREVVMSECFTQIPDKRAELWRHRSCLSIDRYQWRCPGAFPIGQDAYKLARAKVIFDIPSTESDYSASGHAGFTERINALEQQL